MPCGCVGRVVEHIELNPGESIPCECGYTVVRHALPSEDSKAFQTRGELTGYYFTLEAAMTAAILDKSIWEISFTITQTGERIRLVRNHGERVFYYKPILHLFDHVK